MENEIDKRIFNNFKQNLVYEKRILDKTNKLHYKLTERQATFLITNDLSCFGRCIARIWSPISRFLFEEK
jgi:hypothetical protein